MKKRISVICLVALTILPLALFGCKGKVEKAEAPQVEGTSPTEATIEMQAPITEPAQTVATETIPPTAAPQAPEKKVALPQEKENRNKDIQRALKAAGFYTGSIDGKIGPKTKSAIVEFQKSKGLKSDGKVGPKTWTELEKYLTQ